MWGGADYERVARQFAPIHADLVARLAPKPGERWLDVGTGTGEVALRAARAGADVTAVDISSELLELAKGKPDADRIAWQLADAQELPFERASFDVVSSCFAVIFAPDPTTAAGELARVCRPGGRLGLTSWRPDEGPHAIYDRFVASESPADDWGTEERVEELLGGAFELEFDEDVWHLTGESPEAVFDFMTEGAPPVKALLSQLAPDDARDFRKAMLEYWDGFRTDAGVDEPRHFLIVEGRRR
jgi:ubiquinone/menaquinone biosynthesis C-methylase UbiE